MSMSRLSDWFRGLTRNPGAVTRAAVRGRRHGRLLGVEGLEDRMLLTFGLTSTSSAYVVDTGTQLVFTISKTNGDLTSIKYKGTELTAPYSQTSRYSHYESGLSSTQTTVTATLNAANGTILVTAKDTSLGVTQYYAARSGSNAIYMATYAGAATSPDPGEMRYIFYMNKGVFPNV